MCVCKFRFSCAAGYNASHNANSEKSNVQFIGLVVFCSCYPVCLSVNLNIEDTSFCIVVLVFSSPLPLRFTFVDAMLYAHISWIEHAPFPNNPLKSLLGRYQKLTDYHQHLARILD